MFNHFSFDRVSFGLGFLAASLFWWLATKFRPAIEKGINALREQLHAAKSEQTDNTTARYRQDVLTHAQGLHLASPLFSLDEILVVPRILAPPILPNLQDSDSSLSSDIISQTIPYMPDWTALPAYYQARTLSLPQAVQSGVNFLLTAPAGYGKTVAMASLASGLARMDEAYGDWQNHLPILIHAANLNFVDPPKNVVEPLLAATEIYCQTRTRSQLPGIFQSALQSGQAVVLLDGMDELCPDAHQPILTWLKALLKAYPDITLVAAADNTFWDGLPALGLVPLALVTWSEQQKANFLNRWGKLWQSHVTNALLASQDNVPEDIDPLLLNGWLQSNLDTSSPLEFTLKAWAAYAGDLVGAAPLHGMLAYIRRMVPNLDSIPGLEHLALEWLRNDLAAPSYKQAKQWIKELEPVSKVTESDETNTSTETTQKVSSSLLDELLETGLLVECTGERIRFSHILVPGYLAGKALAHAHTQENAATLLPQLAWTPISMALRTYCSQTSPDSWMSAWLTDEDNPLHHRLLTAARWLPDAPAKSSWRVDIMRRLAALLGSGSEISAVRLRACMALIGSGDAGVALLLGNFLKTQDPTILQIALLGLGLFQDQKSVPQLTEFLNHPTPQVYQAACLALVAIGNNTSLEAVAGLLINGDETQQKAAAEALANHPEEGYPTLQEGSTLDNLLVRRAVVFGLQRIEQPWARELIQKMQLEDSQWMVRASAEQALNEIENAHTNLVHAPIPLNETPWLIEYAAQQGMGVAPGKPAINLLLRVLKDGTPEQKITALDRLRYISLPDVLPGLYQSLFTIDPEIQGAVWNTLWHLQASGLEIPSPTKFGLG